MKKPRYGRGWCVQTGFVVCRARYVIRSPSCADTLRPIGGVVIVWSAYGDVVLAWLAAIVLGSLIYFFPLVQFLERFAE
jgi:hypothetical protein